jgi:putative flavoprotein involved in K+ transport
MRALIVIGAGPAGLATAGVARRMGVEPLLIDKAPTVGGAWTRMRPEMMTLSPRRFDRMPDGSAPVGSGERAVAAEVLEWLRAYAEREQFTFRPNTTVTQLEVNESGLVLQTSAERLTAAAVVAASGEHGRPWVPSLQGTFDGMQVHSSLLDTETVPSGAKVLVIGSGNSAAEVTKLLLERGAEVTVAARSDLNGGVGLASGWLADLKWRLSALPLRYLPGAGGCRPSTPTVDDVLQNARESGQIAVRPEVVSLQSGGAQCRDGTTVAADIIVWATGFRRDIAWLPTAVQRDASGLPQHDEGLSTDIKGLGFVGLPCMRTRRSGFIRGFQGDARALLERLL